MYIRLVVCDYNYIFELWFVCEYICGCLLGLWFEKRMGELYIVDVYFGILKVGLEGGLVEFVVIGFYGDLFKFCNDFDFDEDGNFYFIVSSIKY